MSFDPAALVKLIEESGIPKRQNSISFIFTCPRCLKDSKLYIRKRDGKFVCWVCAETNNFKGRAEWALRELLDIPVRQIQERLYGGDLPEQLPGYLELELDDVWSEEESEEVVLEPPPQTYAFPPDFYSVHDPLFAEGARYLHSRGVTIEHVNTYDVRYCPSDRRVVFPVKVDGQILGWQARYIGKTEVKDPVTGKVYKIPKVLTSDSLRDTGQRWVMFQDRLKNSPHCVLTEGPIDAVKAHLCGGNVAAMGKGVSERQMQTILSYGVRTIYFGLDRNAAADISRLVEKLPSDVDAFLLLPPEGRDDLGDCSQEEVFEQFKRAPRIPRGALMLSLGSDFAW